MISARGVSYSIGARIVLSNLVISISDGEKVGLVGDNGAGKTTLLRMLAGELSPDNGELKVGSFGQKVCYIPQFLDPYQLDQFGTSDVLTYLLSCRGLLQVLDRKELLEKQMESGGETLDYVQIANEYQEVLEEYQSLEGYTAEGQILDILIGVGLQTIDPSTPICRLSGGQKSRVSLANLLFQRSDILLLDEPTNHLDEEAIDWLIQFLVQAKQTVLLVSHIGSLLDKVVNRVIYIDRNMGITKSYPGSYSHFLKTLTQEQELRDREKKILEIEIDKQVKFIQGASQTKATMKHERERLVDRLKEDLAQVKIASKTKTSKMAFKQRKPLHQHPISVEGLIKSFGQRRLFANLTFAINPGDRLAVTGENGVGKTTLMRILAGDTKADEGTIVKAKNLRLGWYSQEQEHLGNENSVLEELKQVSGSLPERTVRSALAHFLFFADQVDQKVGTLSRGERSRLVLCKLMMSGPNLLLLDEPTNHLDRKATTNLITALKDYPGAVIVISHDMEFLHSILVNWAIKMPSGRLERI